MFYVILMESCPLIHPNPGSEALIMKSCQSKGIKLQFYFTSFLLHSTTQHLLLFRSVESCTTIWLWNHVKVNVFAVQHKFNIWNVFRVQISLLYKQLLDSCSCTSHLKLYISCSLAQPAALVQMVKLWLKLLCTGEWGYTVTFHSRYRLLNTFVGGKTL